MSDRKFIHVADAARRQGIGKTKLYELIAAGSLRAYKLGRRTLIDPHDLDECFERNLTPLRPEGVEAIEDEVTKSPADEPSNINTASASSPPGETGRRVRGRGLSSLASQPKSTSN